VDCPRGSDRLVATLGCRDFASPGSPVIVSLSGHRSAGYDLRASPESVDQSVLCDSVGKQQGSIAVEIDWVGELMLKGSDRLRSDAGSHSSVLPRRLARPDRRRLEERPRETHVW
jgi:hypothetical protein